MNIISFSLWGDLPIYNVGAVENAKLRATIYPDWICRYYIDETVPIDTINKLKDLGCQLIFMEKVDGFKRLFWRFFPAEDKSISRFIVRDCDSRINIKEASAVNEWINSRKPVHIMRDHIFHNLPILGGMWGGIGGIIKNIKEASAKYVMEKNKTNFKNFYNLDQMFLNERFWPKIKEHHLAHSNIKMFGNELNFPIQLKNGMFVGQVFNENNQPFDATRKNPLI